MAEKRGAGFNKSRDTHPLIAQSSGSLNARALREGNISLILDSYDDLFSDFDPRPYSEKALSDDFKHECTKAARDKEKNGFELRLLVPQAKRSLKDEILIKRRLHEHFHKHSLEKKDEMAIIFREGIVWVSISIVLILAATYLRDYQTSFLMKLLLVLFEPAGWFSVWTGLDKLFFGSKDLKRDYEFYTKMALSKIDFFSY